MRRYRGPFRLSDAFCRRQFSADYTIIMFGFDFRQAQGADGYLLANVLHDWDDDRGVAILKNCRRALAPGGRVLVIERLIPDDPSAAAPTLLSDITMLVFTGGRERTNAEYERLFNSADLSRAVVKPVVFPYGVVEG